VDIKIQIKKYGFTQFEIADLLHISRPTLNSYIRQYEEKERVNNEKYDIIFNKLFSKELDKEKFKETLESFGSLIARDSDKGIMDLSAELTDLFTSIEKHMKEDLHSKNADEDIYIFINMIITSYKQEPIFKKLASYFLYLNGQKNLNTIQYEDKVYLSNYYKLFLSDKLKTLKIDTPFMSKFIEDAGEMIKRNEKKRTKKYEEKISILLKNEVDKVVNSISDQGMGINSLDIDEILSNIVKNRKLNNGISKCFK